MAVGVLNAVGSFLTINKVIKQFSSVNTTIAQGDLVILRAGKIDVAAAGENVLGVAMSAMTTATTVAEVDVTPGMQIAMDSSSTGIVSTDPGKFFDIVGGTGAMQVDISTRDATYTGAGTTKTLLCLQVNPQNIGFDGTTSVGIYSLRKPQMNI